MVKWKYKIRRVRNRIFDYQ